MNKKKKKTKVERGLKKGLKEALAHEQGKIKLRTSMRNLV